MLPISNFVINCSNPLRNVKLLWLTLWVGPGGSPGTPFPTKRKTKSLQLNCVFSPPDPEPENPFPNQVPKTFLIIWNKEKRSLFYKDFFFDIWLCNCPSLPPQGMRPFYPYGSVDNEGCGEYGNREESYHRKRNKILVSLLLKPIGHSPVKGIPSEQLNSVQNLLSAIVMRKPTSSPHGDGATFLSPLHPSPLSPGLLPSWGSYKIH